MTWLELKPETGRTHQIRVHCADAGCPVIGDRFYGRPEPGQQLHLHSRGDRAAAVEEQAAGRSSTAPPPPHMMAALDGLRLQSFDLTQIRSVSPISKPASRAACELVARIRSRPAAGAGKSAAASSASERQTAARIGGIGDHVGQADDALGAIEHAAGHDLEAAAAGEHREIRDRRTAGARRCRSVSRCQTMSDDGAGHRASTLRIQRASNSTLEAQAREVERVEAVLHRPAAGQVRLQQDVDRLALLGDRRPRRAAASRRWDRSAAPARH